MRWTDSTKAPVPSGSAFLAALPITDPQHDQIIAAIRETFTVVSYPHASLPAYRCFTAFPGKNNRMLPKELTRFLTSRKDILFCPLRQFYHSPMAFDIRFSAKILSQMLGFTLLPKIECFFPVSDTHVRVFADCDHTQLALVLAGLPERTNA